MLTVCALLLFCQTVLADPLHDLSESMLTRLAAAELVAEAKYATGRPIEDLKREAVVIDKAAGSAAGYSVDIDFARAFFQAQIDANKWVQRKLISGWKTEHHAPLDDPPNLAQEVRPIYDALTPKLLSQLKATFPILRAQGGCAALRKIAADRRGHTYYPAFRIAIDPLAGIPGGGCMLED